MANAASPPTMAALLSDAPPPMGSRRGDLPYSRSNREMTLTVWPMIISMAGSGGDSLRDEEYCRHSKGDVDSGAQGDDGDKERKRYGHNAGHGHDNGYSARTHPFVESSDSDPSSNSRDHCPQEILRAGRPVGSKEGPRAEQDRPTEV